MQLSIWQPFNRNPTESFLKAREILETDSQHFAHLTGHLKKLPHNPEKNNAGYFLGGVAFGGVGPLDSHETYFQVSKRIFCEMEGSMRPRSSFIQTTCDSQ